MLTVIHTDRRVIAVVPRDATIATPHSTTDVDDADDYAGFAQYTGYAENLPPEFAAVEAEAGGPLLRLPAALWARVPEAEQGAVLTASLSDAGVAGLLFRFNQSTRIDVRHPDYVAGIAALAQAGLISADTQAALTS